MKAVNLIPGDNARRGAAAGAGSAAYYVLGALGVLVVVMALYVLTGNQVNSRRAEVAKASQEATTLEQQAAALKPYADFATLSRTRTETVASLADSRFDWERAMRDLSRALPENVWLTSLVGTVKPGVAFDGGGSGATGALRAAVQSPAIEMLGCTESQSEVSRVMARLRTMRGVQRVSLQSSEKAEGATGPGGGGGGAATGGDCRQGSANFPQFQIVVFFDPPKAPAQAGQGAAPAQPGQAAAPAQPVSQPTSNGSGQ